jgi:hypothetical protein
LFRLEINMATRPRGTSGRASKKQAPPRFGGSVLEDENTNRAQPGSSNERSGGDPQESRAEITGGSLERRDIPSFSDSREQRIAEAAYWRAERRGFQPGHELDDWLEAEREHDARQNEPRLNQKPDERTG